VTDRLMVLSAFLAGISMEITPLTIALSLANYNWYRMQKKSVSSLETNASTALVAGASGYIGSHLVLNLISEGFRVIGLDQKPSVFAREPNYTHIQIDLRDSSAVSALRLPRDVNSMFHLATSSDMVSTFKTKLNYISTEILKVENLLSISGLRSDLTLIFASSCSVYGNTLSGPANEETPLNPLSPYAEGKKSVEEYLQKRIQEVGFPRVGVSRFFNVVGRNNKAQLFENHFPETHLLPILVRCAREGMPVDIYASTMTTKDGSCVRDFVDVRDISKGLLAVFEFLTRNRGVAYRVWNFASNRPLTVLDMVSLVESSMGMRLKLNKKGPRVGDPAMAIADNSRALEELKWQPEYSIQASIDSLLI
jgi:UDP-glucose 4-epimerase